MDYPMISPSYIKLKKKKKNTNPRYSLQRSGTSQLAVWLLKPMIKTYAWLFTERPVLTGESHLNYA